MRFVRTLLAFAIAISLAVLPIGVSAAGVAMSAGDMQTSMHMSGQDDMSMDSCCPDDVKGTTSHSDSDKCGMAFCCAGGTVALGDVNGLAVALAAVASTEIALPADQVVSLHSGNPPFRPPRV